MKIAILGVGNMGGALAKGFLHSGIAPADIVLSRVRPGTPQALEGLGLRVLQDNTEAVREADVVFVAVKPHTVGAVLQPLAGALKLEATVISVAAGVMLAELEGHLRLARSASVVRAMPNTAVELGCGVTALASNGPAGLSVAQALMARLGLVVEFPEAQFDALTALSGCGIAYALRFLRAGQEAGVQMGISAAMASDIFAQVMKGAAELVLRTGNHPEVEIDRVCTPGGLTIRGINALERAGFTSAVVQGLLASLPEK